MKFYRTLVVLAVATSLTAAAQQGFVELDNGSRIVGKVVGIAGGKVKVKTDFAGVIEVDFDRVTGMATEEPLMIGLDSGNTLFGTFRPEESGLTIQTADGTMSVPRGKVKAAWGESERSPLLPPPIVTRKWTYEAGINASGKTGNTEKAGYGASIKAVLQGPEDKLMFYGKAKRAEEEGVKTEDETIGGIDFERRIGKKHAWYSRVELERDDIEGLDLRTTAALGYGYYFLDRPGHQLRGRTGFLFRHESYTDGNSESSPGVDFGLHHMVDLGKWAKLVTDVTYTPSFEDFADYRLDHTSTADIPLAGSENWKLRLGITNSYNSMPAPGVEYLDTTYFGQLVYTWD